LYPLFSPQSLIAEGTANYGIDLAFPGNERQEFERNVLFPMAGLDPNEADRFYQLLELLGRLNYTSNQAARDLLDGVKDEEQTTRWLQRYALRSPERAAQSIRFYRAYRSYVINYNLGQDLVRDYVEAGLDDPQVHWARFKTLLSSPLQASDLVSESN